MTTLTKTERVALGFTTDEALPSDAELVELTYSSWIVWDDAPMPCWQRRKHMDVLENLAKRLGEPIPYA